MPLTITTSAHCQSPSVALQMFSSMKRTLQSFGIYAATTSRPCGGMNARTPFINR
jgi:hypothetical protein